MAVIYGIRPRAEKNYFYIGSTKYDAESRFAHHLSAARNDNHPNKYFQNKTKKLGFDVAVDVIETVDDSIQFEREERLIKKYAKKHKLVNRMHNGFLYKELSDEALDYAEKHYCELTPEKFWQGYWAIKSYNVPASELEYLFIETLRKLMNAMLTRYPDEVKRVYGWQLGETG
jgi:predicted GIY-YIG superfamily endonuclease